MNLCLLIIFCRFEVQFVVVKECFESVKVGSIRGFNVNGGFNFVNVGSCIVKFLCGGGGDVLVLVVNFMIQILQNEGGGSSNKCVSWFFNKL